MKTTGTPAVEWPPGGASSTTSTASPRRAPTDFGALLDQHQARTAVAEGPKKKEAKLEKDHSASAHAAPAQHTAEPKKAEAGHCESQPATEQQQPHPAVEPEVEGQEQPAVEAPVVAVDPLVELTAPVLAEPQAPVTAPAAPQQPVAEVPAAQQPVAAQQAPVAAQPAQAAVAAPVAVEAPVTTQQPAEAAAPVTEQQAAAQPQPAATAAVADEAPAEGTANEAAPQAPVTRADKPAQQQPQQQQQGGQPQQQSADQRSAEQPHGQAQSPQAQGPQAAVADAPRGAQQQAVHQNQPGPQAAQPAAPVTAPAATPAPQAVSNAAAPALARSVPLSQAADAVENVIRLGSARGVTHARMSLRPAELGGIEIRLQQTSTGLVASVVADGAEAAHALQQAGHDLQRRLESHGIELQRLEITYAGEERSGARSAQARAGDGELGSSAGDTDSHATDGGDLTPTDETTATSTLELPDGVLVDVLA